MIAAWGKLSVLGFIALPILLAGCTQSADRLGDGLKTSSVQAKSYAYTTKDKECLARAMFFESHRSSRDGLVAVGTVVMNRLESGHYGDTVCGVVGQKGQFAPGVLSRSMNSAALPDVQSAAEAVLKGERHPKVKDAMFFHTAGLKFPYKNMHYVLVAGGNAFYEKRSRRRAPQLEAPGVAETAIASAEPVQAETVVARAAPVPTSAPARGEPAASAATAVASAQDSEAASAVSAQATAEATTVASVSPRSTPKSDRLASSGARLPQPARSETRRQTVAVADDDGAPDAGQAVFSYEASPEAADAIGALILTQDRPTFE